MKNMALLVAIILLSSATLAASSEVLTAKKRIAIMPHWQ